MASSRQKKRDSARFVERDIEGSVLRRFFLGFPGRTLSHQLRKMLARGLGGVVIYRRNWTTIESLRALTAEIRAAAGGPVLIGIDQEGGTRFSLPPPFAERISPEELGRRNDLKLLEKQAQEMGLELRDAGVSLDFAPMLDLHVNSESPVTKVRSFGADPKKVGACGRAFIRGMRRAGVLTCAKHFPGHGDAAVDPHEDLPRFDGTRALLAKRDLVPFGAAVRAGVPIVMTAHILLPRIDAKRPASLSRLVLQGLLRRRLAFRGVILADDLGMGAISRRYGAGEAAVESLRAGCDMVMLCHDWSLVRPAIDAVTAAHRRGAFDASEWRETDIRIARMLRR
jgi:beta-N-acetylhexosaminidase